MYLLKVYCEKRFSRPWRTLSLPRTKTFKPVKRKCNVFAGMWQMNKMWSMMLKICRSRDLTLCEIPEHIRRRYKNTTLRTCFSGHGVHLVFLDRQETSIINDEVNARTVCQRSCSALASSVAREWRRLSQSRWRRAAGPGRSSPSRLLRSV